MDATNVIFYIVILVMSIVIHEVSHGFTAEYFGDKTARHAGRLTLNPLVHLDPFGSLLLPLVLYFTTGFAFGWARPVPYNPDNLSNRKWGTVAVAGAGVAANILIAIIFGFLICLTEGQTLPPGFYFITSSIVIINLALAIFNLVPIPPLDGSKILFSLLPRVAEPVTEFLERYGFFLLLIFIFFFSQHLYPILAFFYRLIFAI